MEGEVEAVGVGAAADEAAGGVGEFEGGHGGKCPLSMVNCPLLVGGQSLSVVVVG